MKRLVTRLAPRILRRLIDFGNLVHPCACLSKIWGVRICEGNVVIVIVEGAVGRFLCNIFTSLPHYILSVWRSQHEPSACDSVIRLPSASCDREVACCEGAPDAGNVPIWRPSWSQLSVF
jgi:hypothetical protein